MADEISDDADAADLFSRLNSYFHDNNTAEYQWTDIKDVYIRLKEKVKDPNNRCLRYFIVKL